jgi:hypothetical protein
MDGEISVRIDIPGKAPIIVGYRIPYQTWYHEHLGPIPREHDNPLEIAYAVINKQPIPGFKHKEQREKFIDQVVRTLKEIIVSELEKQDPVRGYYSHERA